ncbi:MAG TPA: methyltransferase domain-containing protein [Burkholderiales bacterium]|nr:methyltransferase domain-containing protein [Burkholderiales bacterium]
MEKHAQASIEVALGWESSDATHTDRLFLTRVNFERDIFPGSLADPLQRDGVGAWARESFRPGELLPPQRRDQIHVIRRQQFRTRLGGGGEIHLGVGRFYPRGLVEGVADNFPQDRRPCRLLDARGDELVVDFNHPLAQYPLRVEARLLGLDPVREDRGGRCADIVEEAASGGPGLQAAMAHRETDFMSGAPWARSDESEESVFYQAPRLVDHLDRTALGQVRDLYARFLRPGMRVLDLMSSWTSHLPADQGLQVAGLGMNQEELARNPLLSERVVRDLNRDPSLPFGDAAFDLAVCTVSVEYLVRPVEVFREVARVLRSGAPFVLTFSERWFPPKVVRLWTELHPFELMGLVLAHFRRAGGYTTLGTESVRGLLRPGDDKYAATTPLSDPVYAVWGMKV